MKNFVSESALWALANALGVGVPTLSAHVVCYHVLGMPVYKSGLIMAMAALLTLTWGSWSGLVWAKNRMLRAAMQMMTILPGLLLLVLSGAGFYVGRGGLLIWLGLSAVGLGTVAASFMLARNIGATPASASGSKYALGLGVFPFLATLGGGGILYLWQLFVSGPVYDDWRMIFGLAFFFTSTLSIVLVSTIVPALVTVLCRQLAAPRGGA